MALTVNFYQIKKRRNSTALPKSTPRTFQCSLISDCDILNPNIRLMFDGNDDSIIALNYAYIPTFSRYYWVTNWTYTNRAWVASLSVDVLASYKTEIGNSNQYIARSSNSIAIDTSLIDDQYPAKSGYTVIETAASENSLATDPYTGGCYIVAIAGSADVTGMVSYYVFNTLEFINFAKAVFQQDPVSAGIADFLSYVVWAKWFPIPISALTLEDVQYVNFGWWNIKYSAKVLTGATMSVAVDIPFYQIPHHPQTAAYGRFVECEPYTQRAIYWPLIGSQPIDNAQVLQSSNITLHLYVDVRGGDCTWIIKTWDKIISSGRTNLAVDIALSQNSQSLSSFVDLFNALYQAQAQPIASLGKVVSAVHNLAPQTKMAGSTGSFHAFMLTPPILQTRFLQLPTPDRDRFGSPAYGQHTINTIPGYIETANAYLKIGATVDEINEIISYMNGGFYYE